MILAYNTEKLDNILIQDEATAAMEKGLITKEEQQAIATAHAAGLYAPNIFIRIGLFIITAISGLLAVGFGLLMMLDAGKSTLAGASFMAAVVFYTAGELFIHHKNHYKSGVDTALLWLTGGMLIVFYIAADFPGYNNLIALYVMVIAGWMAVRFADVPMAVVAYLAFIYFIFYTVFNNFAGAKLVMPFLIALISFGVYFVSRRMAQRELLRHYINCFSILEITSLLTLYFSLNYFVVREVSNEMLGLYLKPGQGIPFGWLFWIFTVLLPVVYITTGLRKKDRILIGSGLLLVAVAVYTIRYYHSILPLETAMVLAGGFLCLLAWGVMRYLHPPKHGFTAKEDDEKGAIEKLHLESLVITQTMGHTEQAPVEPKGFGGGSGIGGGASGGY